MAVRLRSRASFWTQSNALLRKNATFQKRNVCSNVCLVLIPALLCLILFGLDQISKYGDNRKPKAKHDCDWRSTDPICPILNPQEWPPLLYVPFEPCTDNSKASSCHLNVLATGNNRSLGQLLAGNMFSVDWNTTNVLDYMAGNVMGTRSTIVSSVFEDGAFSYPEFIKVQQKCSRNNSTFSIPLLGSEVRRRPPHEVVRRLASTSPSGPPFRSTPNPPQPRRPIPNPPPVLVQPQFRNQPGPNSPQARARHSPPPSPARNPPQTSSSPPTQSPSLTPNSAQSPGQAPSPSPFSVLRRDAQATALARDSSPSWDQKDERKTTKVRCIEALPLWRNTSSDVNNELYKGFDRTKHSQILAAYDFSNSNENNFNLTVWYNPSSRLYEYGNGDNDRPSLLRVGRSINLASNAYLQFLQGSGTKILFEFIKEMPKPVTGVPELDVASMFSGLFFTWVILLLFPVVLKTLVYEKQQKLRIMMKMHGLGDGPYWLISYGYFLTVCTIYMLVFVAVGSLLGFKLFTINDYSIQLVFFFLYINLQIAAAFLVATLFSNVKACTVVAYILVFGTGLLAEVFVPSFIKDPSHSSPAVILLQLYPGFALYRGLYELASYPLENRKVGMRWGDFSYARRGMRDLLILMLIEWFVVLFVAYYIDQVVSSGGAKGPFFFLQRFRKKKHSSPRKYSLRSQGSNVAFQMEKPDVVHEIEVVERLVMEGDTSHAIVCDNIKKVYPGRDGNPEKYAVKGLSLALPPGECFGMLGPNGAGKTSFISMMTGLTKSTSGTAYVHGMDIQTRMDDIYSSMGFCPQHDLLWETLTGREHLLFYGRLKNLKGSVLKQAVNESLKSVNLFHGGVADKQAGKYSGGMKRRLSVAISLIGDPKVVYMDEPSTGLDPASRNHLWNVIKSAKQDRAIILTTHSMEEAEVLCDRLGIFVDGRMQCIGHPKELKARYGGSYIFTMTTSWEHEQEVERMVQHMSPNANKTYRLSGTQKFELPKNEVRIADVFQTVEYAKSRFPVFAWGVADTTLEDVFIKVATTGSSPVTLS